MSWSFRCGDEESDGHHGRNMEEHARKIKASRWPTNERTCRMGLTRYEEAIPCQIFKVGRRGNDSQQMVLEREYISKIGCCSALTKLG